MALVTPQDIKDLHASASFCRNTQVVFNVGGNKDRLVVELQILTTLIEVYENKY